MVRSLWSGVLIGFVFLLLLGVTGPTAQVTINRGWSSVSGTLLFAPDNTNDIGAAGATRARDLYLTRKIVVTGGGTPALSACGTGTLATGSSDTVGRITATGATACTLTFSASFGGNSADCMMSNMTANRGNLSAVSSTAFTLSNLTAGDVVAYLCVGR